MSRLCFCYSNIVHSRNEPSMFLLFKHCIFLHPKSRDYILAVFLCFYYTNISFTLAEGFFFLQSHTIQLNNLVRFVHRITCSPTRILQIVFHHNHSKYLLIKEFISSTFPANGEAIVEGILSV